QGGEIGEIDALVDLVHGLPDEAELGDRAIGLDEPGIRGAAARAEFRQPSGDPADRFGEAVAERAGFRQERLAADRNVERVPSTHRLPTPGYPALEFLAGPVIVKADVEDGVRSGRDHV